MDSVEQIVNAVREEMRRTLRRAHLDLVAEAKRQLRPVSQIEERLASIEADLAELRAHQVQGADGDGWDRVLREASRGEWRPWEWAEDLGVSEIEVVQRLKAEHRKMMAG